MNEQLKIIISAEIDKLKQGVQKAKDEVKGFKDQVKDASKDVDKNFKAVGSAIATGLKAGVAAIAAAGAALIALGASTQEYRQEQAKLNTAFETAGASASVAKDTYNDLYRVLGDSGVAVEAAGHLAQMTTNEKELAQWTNICQGVYATFGDSIPIEGLTEAANETAKVGQVTGTLADALNWAGVNEDEFNEKLAKCNSEAEREKLIRETLNGIYNEAAATYETTAADVLKQNEAQAKLQETTAKLGEVVAPVVTAFTNFASDALAVVTPYLQTLAENYMPQLEEALSKVATGLQTAFEWASQHKTLLQVMAGIIATIVTAIGLYNAVAAVKAAMAAAEVTTVWALVSAYVAQAAAMIVVIAPYVAIVAAIAAVIAIIVICIKHWDEIKEACKKAFDKIREVVSSAIDKVVGFFQKLFGWISNNWQGLLLLIVNPFAGAFKLAYDNCEGFREKVNTVFANIKNGISEKVNSAKTAVTTAFNNIKSGITEKINGARDAVKTAIDKIKSFFNFSWSLPKLKMPTIKITGKFSLSPLSVPKFSISWNKLGGIFDKPTLFNYGDSLQGIGEDGAEAVVPLEKNTKWLDRIADRLAAKQGRTPIIMQVDGKTFAQISVDSINDLTRQTGNLPLKLA